jgi:hypothetical protein
MLNPARSLTRPGAFFFFFLQLKIDQRQYTTPSKAKVDITTVSSNYHIEINPRYAHASGDAQQYNADSPSPDVSPPAFCSVLFQRCRHSRLLRYPRAAERDCRNQSAGCELPAVIQRHASRAME